MAHSDDFSALTAALAGAHQTGQVTVFGHTFFLRTLGPSEDAWVSTKVSDSGAFAAATSRRAPTVAAAITHIEFPHKPGVKIPVDELFKVQARDEITQEALERALKQPELKRQWVMDSLLEWLVDPKGQGLFIREIYSEYFRLDAKRKEALLAIGPLYVASAELAMDGFLGKSTTKPAEESPSTNSESSGSPSSAT